MIVEFLGIPGSGKTYKANLYKKELEDKGVPYIDLSRWKGTPFWLKCFYKITDFAYIIVPRYRKLRKKIYSLSKHNYNKEPKYLPFSIDYCIQRIISSILVRDFFRFCKKISINDEGLMQWVVFLNVQYEIEITDILLLLKTMKSNSKTIFIDTPIETAFTNIKKRNRHICPMDEMDDEMLIGYLTDFRKSCYMIKNSETLIKS